MRTAIESARPDLSTVSLGGQTGLAELLACKIPLSRAAQMLDLSLCQLHRYRQTGKLRCFKVGGRWYTTEESMTSLVTFPDGQAPAPPLTSPRRQREILEADRRAAEMLQAPPRRRADIPPCARERRES